MFELSDLAQRADGLPVMKQSILKVIAGMYDPIGLLSPVPVGMKVLFQELCASMVEWDERLTGKFEKRWRGCLKDKRGQKTFTFQVVFMEQSRVRLIVRGMDLPMLAKWPIGCYLFCV